MLWCPATQKNNILSDATFYDEFLVWIFWTSLWLQEREVHLRMWSKLQNMWAFRRKKKLSYGHFEEIPLEAILKTLLWPFWMTCSGNFEEGLLVTVLRMDLFWEFWRRTSCDTFWSSISCVKQIYFKDCVGCHDNTRSGCHDAQLSGSFFAYHYLSVCWLYAAKYKYEANKSKKGPLTEC